MEKYIHRLISGIMYAGTFVICYKFVGIFGTIITIGFAIGVINERLGDK